ncbi:MAG: hypothetical protein WBM38_03405 [Arenicellales bacterium]
MKHITSLRDDPYPGPRVASALLVAVKASSTHTLGGLKLAR